MQRPHLDLDPSPGPPRRAKVEGHKASAAFGAERSDSTGEQEHGDDRGQYRQEHEREGSARRLGGEPGPGADQKGDGDHGDDNAGQVVLGHGGDEDGLGEVHLASFERTNRATSGNDGPEVPVRQDSVPGPRLTARGGRQRTSALELPIRARTAVTRQLRDSEGRRDGRWPLKLEGPAADVDCTWVRVSAPKFND